MNDWKQADRFNGQKLDEQDATASAVDHALSLDAGAGRETMSLSDNKSSETTSIDTTSMDNTSDNKTLNDPALASDTYETRDGKDVKQATIEPETSTHYTLSHQSLDQNLMDRQHIDRQKIEALARLLQQGDRRTLARCISWVESSKPELRQLGEQLLTVAGNDHECLALRIGIAGAAGAGKSTLINALGSCLLAQGLKIAVLTIDPSSAVNGGSLLGDATRMADLAANEDAFIRSTPSGTHAGGIAKATSAAVQLCEIAGFDVIIVESLGSGQIEFELTHSVDIFYWLTTPGAGDDLQAMKQGVLEWVDGILITQADRGREQLAAESKSAYEQGIALYRKQVQVVSISALDKAQVQQFWSSICQTMRGQLSLEHLWFEAEADPQALVGARQVLTEKREHRLQTWRRLRQQSWCDSILALNELCDWLRVALSARQAWSTEFLQQFAELCGLDGAHMNWHGDSNTIGVQLTAAEASLLSMVLPAELYYETNEQSYWTDQNLPFETVILVPLSLVSDAAGNEFTSIVNPNFSFILGFRYQNTDLRAGDRPAPPCLLLGNWVRSVQSVFFEAELINLQNFVCPKIESGVDSLTGLPNREAFRDHVQQVLMTDAVTLRPAAAGSETSETLDTSGLNPFVFAIDVDDFRRVNEVLGLETGDRLLRLVARVIVQLLETPNDLLARFGGDEFFLCKYLPDHAAAAADFGEAVQHALAHADFDGIDAVSRVQCHIGCVAVKPLMALSQAIFKPADVNEILRAAGAALFAAKSLNTNSVYMYDVRLKQRARKVFLTKNELYRAMAENQFTYLAQPLFDESTKRYFGAELLLRWQHPSRGVLPASEFIESADGLGIMQENDLQLIFRNLDQIIAIAQEYKIIFHLNLSAQLFYEQGIIEFALALEQRGALPYLHFEITEHAFIDRMVLLHQFVYRVKAGGSQLWLDDFGVGYSGLRYLDHLDVDGVKIDQSFVRRLHQPRTRKLFKGMMRLLKEMDLEVLAEGVERPEQAALLKEYGCGKQQGVLHGVAKPLDAFVQMLKDERKAVAGKSSGES